MKHDLMNNKLFLLAFLLVLILLSACESGEKKTTEATVAPDSVVVEPDTLDVYPRRKKFEPVRPLSQFPDTEFLLTPEDSIPQHKNAIYAASMLFAWDEVRKIVNQPFQISDKYPRLKSFHASRSYLNVLEPDEYRVTATVEGDQIRTRAEFALSLPFVSPLTNFTSDPLLFQNESVQSFGEFGIEHGLENVIHILYYKNDNDFIVKLQPADKSHEIILFTSEASHNTVQEIQSTISKKIRKGTQERKSPKTEWKYSMKNEDELIIPKLNFNIEHHFSTLEGNTFSAGGQTFQIFEAVERIGFIIDGEGAGIESIGDFSLSASAGEYEEIPHPKKMHFDEPYFIMLRRINNPNPYFCAWIANSELMMPTK
jgi:hypothetical protein